MTFKKTICEDIWLVFMTINAQVCFVLLSYIPPEVRNFLPPDFGGGAAAPSGYRDRRPCRPTSKLQCQIIRNCAVEQCLIFSTSVCPASIWSARDAATRSSSRFICHAELATLAQLSATGHLHVFTVWQLTT